LEQVARSNIEIFLYIYVVNVSRDGLGLRALAVVHDMDDLGGLVAAEQIDHNVRVRRQEEVASVAGCLVPQESEQPTLDRGVKIILYLFK
jgi:hypothetical protein